jgi:hypothetical protein
MKTIRYILMGIIPCFAFADVNAFDFLGALKSIGANIKNIAVSTGKTALDETNKAATQAFVSTETQLSQVQAQANDAINIANKEIQGATTDLVKYESEFVADEKKDAPVEEQLHTAETNVKMWEAKLAELNKNPSATIHQKLEAATQYKTWAQHYYSLALQHENITMAAKTAADKEMIAAREIEKAIQDAYTAAKNTLEVAKTTEALANAEYMAIHSAATVAQGTASTPPI